jgi:superfamily II DNA or RNA helicase
MEDLFLTNYSEKTFLDKIKESLEKCNSFSFSVSFIKKAGLVLFESILEEALIRGVKGRIITSTYQNFTDIASLRTFMHLMDNYPNFECHLDINCFGDNGFHSKGYLFEYDKSSEFIVGSTNITRFALLKNIEWNVSLTSNENMNSKAEAYKEFDELWNKTLKLSSELIKKYQMQLDYAIDKWDMDFFDPIEDKVKPNSMQRKALKELRRYRDMGVSKALVVSATGSGKTYLAAFDARNYDAKRVLFVVHRDKILEDAKDTFMKVFGPEKTYGLYVGKNKDIDADFVFASNQMLALHLSDFLPNEFDYIVIDECHHAAANSYRSIMNYFKPGFMLGITATPERMDNQDVFEMFDKNVPYELRLRDAIINDLVVPFHYYGIRDKIVDYSFNDNAKISREIAKVENIEFIKSEIEKHRVAGKLKALAFCTSIQHAKLMADELEDVGFNAIALTGSSDLGQRIKTFNDLQDDNNPLEIICAIDILNEGIDIPGVNMVLFLRPTESSTIFLQQLGRGLRKAEGKQYVTVLDFIGNNYDRSIQIAMALGSLGQSSIIEKPYLMDLIRNDFNALKIPGVLINIDELSKEDIITYLSNCNFNRKDFLIKDYENFKKYLKKETYPLHIDFLNNDVAPDLLRLMKSKINGKNRSYYTFLKKIGENTLPIFSNAQISILDTLSEYLPLVRVDEYIIVNQLINDNKIDLESLIGFNSKVSIDTLKHAYNHLLKNGIIDSDNKLLSDINDSFKTFINDLLMYGLERYDIEIGEYSTDFKLYANYYSEQIQLLKLQSYSPYMRGTEFDLENKKTYCYVTLHKDASKNERLKYKDKFLSPNTFQWESVKNTTINKGDGPKLINTKEVYLFIRKIKEEDGVVLPFTYFGKGHFINQRTSYTKEYDKDTNSILEYPTLLFDIVLDNEVPEEYWFDFDIEDKGN